MTVVVADTSPVNYLVLIGNAEVLAQMYGRIVIPEQVFAELTDLDAPNAVRLWITNCPEWVEIRNAPSPEASLSELDPGEAAAISLAETEADVLLLIDETTGRLEATRRGIPHTGTLGVLRRAGILGLIDLPSALERLLGTNFRISKTLVLELLAEDANRRKV